MTNKQVEKMHAAWLLGDIVDRHLCDRNDLTKKERALAETAMDALYSLYQLIGSKMK